MQLKRVFDNMKFLAPESSITSLLEVVERKEILEKMGKKSVRAYVLTEIE